MGVARNPAARRDDSIPIDPPVRAIDVAASLVGHWKAASFTVEVAVGAGVGVLTGVGVDAGVDGTDEPPPPPPQAANTTLLDTTTAKNRGRALPITRPR